MKKVVGSTIIRFLPVGGPGAPTRPPRLLLGLLGLPLLFKRLLSRLLFHALLRVLVLGRHLL